jgi:beta-lactamase superfamily II metal-dependent hydrolase
MAAVKKANPGSKGIAAKKSKDGAAKAKKTPPSEAAGATTSHGQDVTGLRVRMFRIGFGDFFLLSVPASGGPKHILIDCGVHAKDLKTIRSAVQQMVQDCNFHLSLIIMTHRHADHISGFGTCSDIFKQITVDRVWMPWFENPSDRTAQAFQASLTSMANRLSMRLAARGDAESLELANMADNITGGLNAAGVSANQKALDVLHNGFKNTPAHDYYKAGDPAKIPDDLIEAGLAAEILGPPVDSALIAQMTNKSQQYLADDIGTDGDATKLFGRAFESDDKAYEGGAFTFYDPAQIKAMIDSAQPDVLAAQAAAADKTLNNQSLVILFSFVGKNLLFAGDAQWGNWENFLYGGAYGTPGHTVLTAKAKTILNKIHFYKVGHHGSANATPKDAVAAMRLGCVGMCSTQIHAYNEVPREPLLDALRTRMNGQLARSDQVPASPDEPANLDAGPLSSLFKRPTGMLFIDYEL